MSIKRLTSAGLRSFELPYHYTLPPEHPYPPEHSVDGNKAIWPYMRTPDAPGSRQEWEEYSYNPPPRIRNPNWFRNPGGEPFYIAPTEPDDRPEIIPKPTWEGILRGGVKFALPSDLCDYLSLTRDERHAKWEQLIAREVFGADNPRHEHHIRQRGGLGNDADRVAWVKHLRHRYHEIEHWVDEVSDPNFELHWTHVEPLCKFDVESRDVWAGLTWTPPTQVDPFVDHHLVSVPSEPHPGPPPAWNPVATRVSVGGRDVAYRIDVPLRAKVGFGSPRGANTFEVIYKEEVQTGDFEIPHGIFPFTIRLREDVRHQTITLRYSFIGTVVVGQWEWLVTRD